MKIFLVITATYFVAFAIVHTGLLLLAWRNLRRSAREASVTALRRTIRSPLAPPISIIVPAYNEEAGIVDSVRSLLALDYPSTEIVVLSDGSTDGTVERMIEAFDLRRGLAARARAGRRLALPHRQGDLRRAGVPVLDLPGAGPHRVPVRARRRRFAPRARARLTLA